MYPFRETTPTAIPSRLGGEKARLLRARALFSAADGPRVHLPAGLMAGLLAVCCTSLGRCRSPRVQDNGLMHKAGRPLKVQAVGQAKYRTSLTQSSRLVHLKTSTSTVALQWKPSH